MSRSLSKDVLLSLKNEDPRPVYKDIAALLTQLPSDGTLLEIEFLGTSHAMEPGESFLRDDNAVAIPKQKLFQAFSVARQKLQDYLTATTIRVSLEALEASSVILLMDPEHLTAANTRKRALTAASCSPPTSPSLSALKQEKQWVDSILTSRLNRHTKSPNLWAHRRWLVGQILDRVSDLDFNSEMTKVIMISAERHPRNYYAWDHARWLYQTIKRRDIVFCQVEQATHNVRQWCFRHHSDISGWDFLAFLLRDTDQGDGLPDLRNAILQDTLKVTESLRWTNESVWSFLRTIVASGLASDSLVTSFILVNERLSLTCEEESHPKRILRAARQWCDEYRQKPPK